MSCGRMALHCGDELKNSEPAGMGTKRKEPLFERRARVEQQLIRQHTELAVAWRSLEGRAYLIERRALGFTRGFRAVVPLGAIAGAVWLLHRYGPARITRPATLGLSALNFARRALPSLNTFKDRDRNGNSAKWLPIAIAIARPLISGFVRRQRGRHDRRTHAA